MKANRGLHNLTLAAVGVFWLAGCAIRPITPELTHFNPDTGYRWDLQRVVPDNDPHTLLVLTFSGGGTRAAAISFGVLEELRRTVVHAAGGSHPMLDEVDLITGISGGSFTALAYALYGERLFDVYENAFLTRDVQGELLRVYSTRSHGHSCGRRDSGAPSSPRSITTRSCSTAQPTAICSSDRRRGRWRGRPT